MLLDKTKLPLIKEDSYFIYGDSVTGQLYKVFETKTVSANQNRLLLLYIAGAAVIKQADRLYLPFSTPFFNTALLVLFMFLIVLMSQKQLKRWEKFVEYKEFSATANDLSDILSKAQNSLRANTVLLLSLIILFLLTAILFILLSRTVFIIISVLLWYVISLIAPTLRLHARRKLIARLTEKVKK